mmetsp:Transcript_86322/g.200738  ORF Transcript_86322/g.200738 Transcript_86322/m.200738 type:complete len:208 (-) Transcript_86322:143-766(-)
MPQVESVLLHTRLSGLLTRPGREGANELPNARFAGPEQHRVHQQHVGLVLNALEVADGLLATTHPGDIVEEGLRQFHKVLAALEDELLDSGSWVGSQRHSLARPHNIRQSAPQHEAADWCTDPNARCFRVLCTACPSSLLVEALSVRGNVLRVVNHGLDALHAPVLERDRHLQHAPVLLKATLPIGSDDLGPPEALCRAEPGALRPS